MSKINWLVVGFIVTSTFFSSRSFGEALPQVTGLAIDGNVLSWTPQEGADGYNINRDYLYYDTVRGSENYTLTETGTYHVISFNDDGDFGVTVSPDGQEYSVFYESDRQGQGICDSNTENIGPLTLPFSREDYLDSGPSAIAVDYYRFEAEPGIALEAQLLGSPSGSGDLEDPVMGLLDSDCQIISVNDDYLTFESYLRFTVPDDGEFYIAASRYGDFELTGSNQYTEGSTYTLIIDSAPPVIDSISARLINSFSGAPLPGEGSPNAGAELYRCNSDCDQYIAFEYANDDGVVEFTGEFNEFLTPGTYLIRTFAADFESMESGRFSVNGAERFHVGDIAMTPPSIAFGEFTACDDLPPQGGLCTYEIKVDNNTSNTLTALVWSDVEVYGLGSLGYSSFEASITESSDENVTRARLEIPPYSSVATSFKLTVPAFAPAGTQFCQSVWLGEYPNPLLNPLKQDYLFCFVKDPDGYARSSDTQLDKLVARYNEKSNTTQRRTRRLSQQDIQ